MSARRSEPAASPARGALLVAVAVVVGLVLIRSGLDTGEIASSTGDNGGPTTTTGESSTSSTAAARQPGDVTVIVANASGIDGAASRLTTNLKAKGYNAAQPTNASQNVSTTAVHFVAGYEAEAKAVAAAFGAPASAVAPMPSPPPISNLASAHVLVLLGPDLAPKG